jgi:hypothetical protein
MSTLTMLQLFKIFEVDRLGEQVRQDPANSVRLKTALEALEVIRHTPFVSGTEAHHLIQTAWRNFEMGVFAPGRGQRTKIFENEADFGVISAFVDLMSDLITDDTIHAFIRTLQQRGPESLFNDLAKRTSHGGRASKGKEMDDDYVGISNFLDLALDISDFLTNIEDRTFERSILKCLEPWFVLDLEHFFRSVEGLVRQALVANTAVEQDNEQVSVIWKSADAKLRAVRHLVKRVHQQRPQAHPAAPSARAYRSGVSVSVIAQEAQRVVERLSLLDVERARLREQLNELESAERVLTRFGGKVSTTERRRRGRTAPTAGGERRARGGQQAPSVSLSDATLKAVQAHGEGATAGEVLNYLSREFGMTVRPNHLGIALQRHRRAGRLENRDQRWYLPRPGRQSVQSAMTG